MRRSPTVLLSTLPVGTLPRFLGDELASHIEGKAPDDLVFIAPGGGYQEHRLPHPRV
jgi:hypothetical protein